MTAWGRPALFLLILSAVGFFVGLGRRDLWGADELRYASTVREMVESGDWLSPKFDGRDDGEKPPLFYWLSAAVASLRGEADELAVLIPSAIGGFLVLLFTFLLGRRLLGEEGAYVSAAALGTSLGLSWQARIGQMDALFAGLVLGSAVCFVLAPDRERRFPLLLGGYALAALAFLVKGPLCLVLIAVPLAASWVFLRGARNAKAILAQLRGLGLGWGIPLFLLAVAPWFLALGLHQRNGWKLVSKLLWQQNVERYFDFWWGNGESPIVYLEILSDLLPWTLPFLVAFWLAWRKDGWRSEVRRFAATWFAAIFLFFLFADSRRAAYLVPIYPAAALLAASLWVEAIEGASPLSLRWLRFSQGLGFWVGAAAFVGFGLFALLERELPARWRFPFPEAVPALLAFGALFAAGAWISWTRLREGEIVVSMQSWIASLLLCQLVLYLLFVSVMNPYKSRKEEIARLVEPVPAGAELWCYRDERPWAIYYSPKRIAGSAGSERAALKQLDAGRYFLMGEAEFEDLRRRLRSPLEKLGETRGKHKLVLVRKALLADPSSPQVK